MLRLVSLFLLSSLLLEPSGLMWREPETEVILPVLMYHEVKREGLGKDVILPEEMESDLRYLSREGYTTVVMADVLAFVYAGEPLPEKPIMLTFDDGLGSSYRSLFPLLQKYETRAVISVIGKSADEFSRLPENGAHFVHATWSELLEMWDSGLIEL